LWDSRDRDKHYTHHEWPKTVSFAVGKNNIIAELLVNSKKILLPPFHIKFRFMKQFVKALDKDGKCFEYLSEQFPQLTDVKLKEDVFDGPQIRKILRDLCYDND